MVLFIHYPFILSAAHSPNHRLSHNMSQLWMLFIETTIASNSEINGRHLILSILKPNKPTMQISSQRPKSFHLHSTNKTNHSKYGNHLFKRKEQNRPSTLQMSWTKSRRISSSQSSQTRLNNQPHTSTKAAHPRRPSHTNLQSQSISAKQVLAITQHINAIIHQRLLSLYFSKPSTSFCSRWLVIGFSNGNCPIVGSN